MKRICCALLVSLLLVPLSAQSEISSFQSITPSVSLRDGTIPPQTGVELYVFAGEATGTSYTAVFNVSEQPGSIVLIAADMQAYAYDSGAGTLTLTFNHLGYVQGIDTPGPPTDFSIAIIPAVDGTSSGLPTALRGSWMSTNIGPSDWSIIPPSFDNPSFGYELSGPDGQTGFFRMFIPAGFLTFLSSMLGEEIGIDDLAIFNDGTQASLDVTSQEVGGEVVGALVDINVQFSADQTEFPEEEASRSFYALGAPLSGSSVSKELTVGEAQSLSLTADDLSPSKSQTVTLYGWARDGVSGTQVEIFSKNKTAKLKAQAKARGVKFKDKPLKKAAISSNGAYEITLKVTKTDVYQARHKPAGAALRKSAKLRLPVS